MDALTLYLKSMRQSLINLQCCLQISHYLASYFMVLTDDN